MAVVSGFDAASKTTFKAEQRTNATTCGGAPSPSQTPTIAGANVKTIAAGKAAIKADTSVVHAASDAMRPRFFAAHDLNIGGENACMKSAQKL